MKKYTRPELEITEFELEDVLTVSLAKPGTDIDAGWY